MAVRVKGRCCSFSLRDDLPDPGRHERCTQHLVHRLLTQSVDCRCATFAAPQSRAARPARGGPGILRLPCPVLRVISPVNQMASAIVIARQGDLMLPRGTIMVLVGALLAGCANNQPLTTGLAATPVQAAEPERDPSKKTLASKVLSAIALERVTGRKPDPARLNQLN